MEIAVVFWVEEWNDPTAVLGRRLSWVGRSSGLFAPHTKEGPEREQGQDTEGEHTEDERLWKMFVEWYSLLPDWRGREIEGRIQYTPILGWWRMEPIQKYIPKWLGKYKMFQIMLMTHLLKPHDLFSEIVSLILYWISAFYQWVMEMRYLMRYGM